MLYAIRGTDVTNSLDKRKAARPAHLARLEQLREHLAEQVGLAEGLGCNAHGRPLRVDAQRNERCQAGGR